MPDAHADCAVVAAAPASFGTVTSFVLASQRQSTSTTSSGLSCSGAPAGLPAAGDFIEMTVVSRRGGRLAGPTGDRVPYQIHADANRAIPLNPDTAYNWASGRLLNLLGVFGGQSNLLPLYFQIPSGRNVAAGVYLDTLTFSWRWDYCAGIGAGGLCSRRDRGSGSASVQLSATVANDCVIHAPDLSFGAAPIVSNFATVTGSLALRCTKGMAYTVGIGAGGQPHANGRRQMADGAHRLQYDVFGPDGAVWRQADNRASSDGAADGQSSELFPYTAKIYPDQATPPVGAYTDSVIIDVRY
ncbi:Csu type fimbrial protein [Burkholderia sp. FERM BP-3421]|uniref:Csu type fimbrial protein n=1 Tax=Burkholderia sp. FERM BP-3421 TaxID=1494466 RepID=UPI00308240C1